MGHSKWPIAYPDYNTVDSEAYGWKAAATYLVENNDKTIDSYDRPQSFDALAAASV